jgi:hypothetical protein
MNIPLMKFGGSDSAQQINRIFAENLRDLLYKVDEGKGDFEPGFIHTSTMKHEGSCYFGETWSRDGGRVANRTGSFSYKNGGFLRHIFENASRIELKLI